MNNKITYHQAVQRLQENNIDFEVMNINGFLLIVSEYAGRVFGPFLGENEESLGWLNSAFTDSRRFEALVSERDWNIGGERFWLAPEFAFFVKERKRFDDTYLFPDALGAGSYVLETRGTEPRLSQTAELDVFEMPFDKKALEMKRSVRAEEIPFGLAKREIFSSLRCCCYKQTFTVRDMSPYNSMLMEPWILNQINPGGRLLIPYLGNPDFVDYYTPVADYQSVHSGFFELKITGDRKYKVAYKAMNTTGRSVYINKLDDGSYYALVRGYYNDPSNPYCCEPADSVGEKGCSMFVYNDFGGNGGFAEFENSGLSIGGGTGRTEVECELMSWWFVGGKAEIQAIVERLVGIKYIIEL